MQACPICGVDRPTLYNTHRADWQRIDCRRCGEFDISGTALAILPDELRKSIYRPSILSHVVRRMTASARPSIDEYMLPTLFLNDELPTPRRQSNDLLLLVGDQQLSADEGIRLALHFVGAWIGTASFNGPFNGVHWHLNHLQTAGLLSSVHLQHESPEGNQVYSLQLTMPGWDAYEELRRVQSESKTAFMALKFGDPELNRAVDECFKPAVERTGFRLRILSEPGPAGIIDNQMRAGILGSRFVIADLSHGNNGAYWEAGFGEGRGLPVIYTCEKSAWDKQKTHFDTNHLRTIIWSSDNLPDAGAQLSATIRATLPNEALHEID